MSAQASTADEEIGIDWEAFFDEHDLHGDGTAKVAGMASLYLDYVDEHEAQEALEDAKTDGVLQQIDGQWFPAGYEADEGGARAMLRALTHQATHADRDDVDDDPHVHDAPANHVAVCTNQTCAAAGSPAVLERLRQAVRDSDACDARVTRTSCLDQCGDGPMVAVYPDGVWYGGVEEPDADRIVSSHLDRERIVSDLVHATLQ